MDHRAGKYKKGNWTGGLFNGDLLCNISAPALIRAPGGRLLQLNGGAQGQLHLSRDEIENADLIRIRRDPDGSAAFLLTVGNRLVHRLKAQSREMSVPGGTLELILLKETTPAFAPAHRTPGNMHDLSSMQTALGLRTRFIARQRSLEHFGRSSGTRTPEHPVRDLVAQIFRQLRNHATFHDWQKIAFTHDLPRTRSLVDVDASRISSVLLAVIAPFAHDLSPIQCHASWSGWRLRLAVCLDEDLVANARWGATQRGLESTLSSLGTTMEVRPRRHGEGSQAIVTLPLTPTHGSTRRNH